MGNRGSCGPELELNDRRAGGDGEDDRGGESTEGDEDAAGFDHGRIGHASDSPTHSSPSKRIHGFPGIAGTSTEALLQELRLERELANQPEDLAGSAERSRRLEQELSKATVRVQRRRLQERRLRTLVASSAEHAASCRAESGALRGRLAAAREACALTARALQRAEGECGQLQAEHDSLQAERSQLLTGIAGLKKEVEGSRMEKRLQERLQDLALAHLSREREAQGCEKAALSASMQGAIVVATDVALQHQRGFERNGEKCAKLQKDIKRLESQLREVRTSQKLLQQRASDLEAEWGWHSHASASPARRRPAGPWAGSFDLPA